MIRTLRILLGLAVVCTIASPALAKNLCLEATSGTEEGSQLFLKGVDFGPGKLSAVLGYYFDFSPLVTSQRFHPVHGEALVTSSRRIVLGLTMSNVHVHLAGGVTTQGGLSAINIHCPPGPDGRVEVGDACSGFVKDDTAFVADVIDCGDVAPIP